MQRTNMWRKNSVMTVLSLQSKRSKKFASFWKDLKYQKRIKKYDYRSIIYYQYQLFIYQFLLPFKGKGKFSTFSKWKQNIFMSKWIENSTHNSLLWLRFWRNWSNRTTINTYQYRFCVYISIENIKEQRSTFEKCGCRVSFRVQNHTDTVLLSPAAVMRFGGP